MARVGRFGALCVSLAILGAGCGGTSSGGADAGPQVSIAGATAALAPCTAHRLRSVDFITPRVGFAVAGGSYLRVDSGLPLPITGGKLLLTVDSGKQWRPLPGAPANVTSVCFSSGTLGWAGTPEAVWRTVDGGRRWALSFSEPPHFRPILAGVLGRTRDTPEVQCARPSSAWALFLGYDTGMMKTSYVAFATQDGRDWHAVFEEQAFEDHDMPSVHAPQGPGSYPGPFDVVNASTAAFVGQDPGALTVPFDMAYQGGTTVQARGTVPRLGTALGISFVSAAKGWAVGVGENAAGLLRRLHRRRRQELDCPVRAGLRLGSTGPFALTEPQPPWPGRDIAAGLRWSAPPAVRYGANKESCESSADLSIWPLTRHFAESERCARKWTLCMAGSCRAGDGCRAL